MKIAMHTVDPMKASEERKARNRGGFEFDECLSPERKRAKLERLDAEGAMFCRLCCPVPPVVKHRSKGSDTSRQEMDEEDTPPIQMP